MVGRANTPAFFLRRRTPGYVTRTLRKVPAGSGKSQAAGAAALVGWPLAVEAAIAFRSWDAVTARQLPGAGVGFPVAELARCPGEARLHPPP